MYELLFMTILRNETSGTKCLTGESFTWNEYPFKPETKKTMCLNNKLKS